MNGETKSAKKAADTGSKAFLGIISGLLVLAIIVTIALGHRMPSAQGILDSFILLLACAATLVSLSGQLPAQNILLATVIIAVIGTGIQTLNAFTGIPFGPIVYTPESGPRLFNGLLWFFPFWWVTAIFVSRGVARLILRPWRKTRIYGYWLIGLTTLLAILLQFGYEPFATRARHYWIWSPTKLPIDWYLTPLSNFLGWLVTTLLALAFSTPALMKRKPTKSGPAYQPLVIWVALNVLFIVGALSQQLFTAVAVSGAMCVIVIPFAIRGAKW
jgi:uncharacterized membrane protein